MTVITMSRNELTRLRVLIDIADGRLSVADAAGLIGVGRRQIYRLLRCISSSRCGRPDFPEAWSTQQPSTGCGIPRDSAGHRARALRRFWSDLGG